MYNKTRICPICSKILEYTCYSSYYTANNRNAMCRSCRTTIANKSTKRYTKGEANHQWKSPNEIPYSWFSKYFERRLKGKRIGTITIEDVYILWIKQDKKCKLSGIDIGFHDDGLGHTCSIDRIDSKKEYDIDNIQLVHKDINFMKNKFNNEYFIDICKKISENNK